MEFPIEHTPDDLNSAANEKVVISVLHIEDDDFDAALVQRNLKRCDHAKFNISREKTITAALQRLNAQQFDVILLDLHLPDGQGISSVKRFHHVAKTTPLIILTSNERTNKPVEFVNLGVQDFLPKSTIDGKILHHSIRYAILRKEKEIDLREISQHDQLTGLLSRKIVRDRITHAISRHQRSQSRLAVLYIDIDNFKGVNHTLGHAAGDALLKHVAQGLSKSVRKEDSVARMGGDEFVVLLENLKDFSDLRGIITKMIEKAFSPSTIEHEKLRAQLSIGVSTYDGTTKNSVSTNSLLEQADFSMYRAKEKQGSHYEMFDQALRAHHDMREALTQLTDHNFDRSQFRITYAPILATQAGLNSQTALNQNIRQRSLFGAKAQLAWVRHSNEHLLTAELLTIVERMSVAKKLGEWLLREALREWKTYVCHANSPETDSPAPRLFLNLPPKFLYDEHALHTIDACVKALSFDPSCLVLEMYGQDIIEHLSLAQGITTRAKQELGLSVCLSDFGSHHCSIELLQEIPCDYLRLSACFYSPKADPKQSLVIASQTQILASKLGLKVLAPNNCTAEQSKLLQEAGVTLFQMPP
jgi:diguanylate cyclase (GGDEF)-like protein